MSVAIKLTLPDSLAEQTAKLVKSAGYTNVQELALEAIRRFNRDMEHERLMVLLQGLRGSTSGSSLTASQRREFVAEFVEMKEYSEIFRKFDLD